MFATAPRVGQFLIWNRREHWLHVEMLIGTTFKTRRACTPRSPSAASGMPTRMRCSFIILSAECRKNTNVCELKSYSRVTQSPVRLLSQFYVKMKFLQRQFRLHVRHSLFTLTFGNRMQRWGGNPVALIQQCTRSWPSNEHQNNSVDRISCLNCAKFIFDSLAFLGSSAAMSDRSALSYTTQI